MHLFIYVFMYLYIHIIYIDKRIDIDINICLYLFIYSCPAMFCSERLEREARSKHQVSPQGSTLAAPVERRDEMTLASEQVLISTPRS